jgi:tetratricopeptide (TPR) repeat protein
MTASRASVAGWRHNYPEAERLARAGMAEATSPFWKDVAEGNLASIEGAQGHIARSEAGFRAAASIDESNGAMGQYFRRVAQLAQLDLRHEVHVSQAMAMLSDARTRHPLGLIDPSDRQYPELATAYALGGKVDEARSLMDEYARTVPPMMQKSDKERQEALGYIAMAEGHFDEALKNFRAMRVDSPCMLCGTFEVAEAFAKLGQPDSARAYYEEYLVTGGIFRMRADADHLAATYQRLGELYEAKGDRAKARDYYAKLLDLWKTADPELQPIVKDTKERVARLSGEH